MVDAFLDALDKGMFDGRLYNTILYHVQACHDEAQERDPQPLLPVYTDIDALLENLRHIPLGLTSYYYTGEEQGGAASDGLQHPSETAEDELVVARDPTNSQHRLYMPFVETEIYPEQEACAITLLHPPNHPLQSPVFHQGGGGAATQNVPVKTVCGHWFHRICIRKHLHAHTTCPTCDSPLVRLCFPEGDPRTFDQVSLIPFNSDGQGMLTAALGERENVTRAYRRLHGSYAGLIEDLQRRIRQYQRQSSGRGELPTTPFSRTRRRPGPVRSQLADLVAMLRRMMITTVGDMRDLLRLLTVGLPTRFVQLVWQLVLRIPPLLRVREVLRFRAPSQPQGSLHPPGQPDATEVLSALNRDVRSMTTFPPQTVFIGFVGRRVAAVTISTPEFESLLPSPTIEPDGSTIRLSSDRHIVFTRHGSSRLPCVTTVPPTNLNQINDVGMYAMVATEGSRVTLEPRRTADGDPVGISIPTQYTRLFVPQLYRSEGVEYLFVGRLPLAKTRSVLVRHADNIPSHALQDVSQPVHLSEEEAGVTTEASAGQFFDFTQVMNRRPLFLDAILEMYTIPSRVEETDEVQTYVIGSYDEASNVAYMYPDDRLAYTDNTMSLILPHQYPALHATRGPLVDIYAEEVSPSNPFYEVRSPRVGYQYFSSAIMRELFQQNGDEYVIQTGVAPHPLARPWRDFDRVGAIDAEDMDDEQKGGDDNDDMAAS